MTNIYCSSNNTVSIINSYTDPHVCKFIKIYPAYDLIFTFDNCFILLRVWLDLETITDTQAIKVKMGQFSKVQYINKNASLLLCITCAHTHTY